MRSFFSTERSGIKFDHRFDCSLQNQIKCCSLIKSQVLDCIATLGITIWQVAHGYFQPIHIHSHTGSPLIEVNVSAREEIKRLSFVKKKSFFPVFNEILHMSNFHTDVLLFSAILPQ